MPSRFPAPDLTVERRLAYAQAAARDGDHAAAYDILQQTAPLAPDWAPVWLALADAALATGSRDEALACLRRVRDLDPDDVLGALPRLARIEGPFAGQAHSAAHIRTLFDDYAERFDAHLGGQLGYRGPQVLLDALAEACAARDRPVRFDVALDLGCGTGLMGAALRPLCGRIEGCDLSPAMLDKARAKALYDDLDEADIVGFMAARGESAADLVTAADVLVYVGDLAPVMDAAARVLRPGGLFGFTVQSRNGDGYGVGDDLRYAHSQAYLLWAARQAGFEPAVLREATTRVDRGVPVAGLVVVLARPS